MADFAPIEPLYIFMIRKDGVGGVLKYRKDRFDSNKNVQAGYRLATKTEIAKFYDIEEVSGEATKVEPKKFIGDKKDKAQEATSQDKKTVKQALPNDDVITEKVSKSDNI